MDIPSFCRKLEKAEAHSEFVIAAFCDIRNFSDFSRNVESADTSTFLKHFYVRLLTGYFPDAIFAKPTGDGLLIIYRHNEFNLPQISGMVLSGCLRAISDFSSMFRSLPIINYAPPSAIGFGVARGSVSYLACRKEILDYSGKVLNLAARLNELAKPSGVVIDGNFQREVIPEKLRGQFKENTVFLRGIAEDVPIKVFCSPQVKVPAEAFHPIREHKWVKKDEELKVADLSKWSHYGVRIPTPLSRTMIKAEFRYSIGVASRISIEQCSHEYEVDGSGCRVIFDLAQALAVAKREKLPADSWFIMRVHYVPKLDGGPAQPSSA